MSFGIYFDISYELTPIGLFIPLREYSTVNLSLLLHNNKPIEAASCSSFICSSIAVK